MAWIEWNPNPLGRHGNDCTVRAVARALDISWDEAYLLLVIEGFLVKDMPSSNDIWGSALVRMGFSVHPLPGPCPYCITVAEFAAMHPRGTYLVATGTHVVAVVSGNYYDSYDSGGEVLTYAFVKEDDNNGSI